MKARLQFVSSMRKCIEIVPGDHESFLKHLFSAFLRALAPSLYEPKANDTVAPPPTATAAAAAAGYAAAAGSSAVAPRPGQCAFYEVRFGWQSKEVYVVVPYLKQSGGQGWSEATRLTLPSLPLNRSVALPCASHPHRTTRRTRFAMGS